MEAYSSPLLQCAICGLLFKQKSDLNDHMLVQHLQSKEIHLCSYCGKKFFSEKSLELHTAVHEMELKHKAVSKLSEEQSIFPNQASIIADNVEQTIAKVPQIKVRVRAFPANSSTSGDARYVGGHHADIMDFQLKEEEFDVIEESEIYTTQSDESVVAENAPLQLKVWSKVENHMPTGRATVSSSSNPSPYIIKVQNKTLPDSKVINSNLLTTNINDDHSQEPIRIFVGSNIRLEDVTDFQQITPSGSKLKNEGNLGMCESVYYYGASEDSSQQNDFQQQLLQQEESDEDFTSLEQSFPEKMVGEVFESYQETSEDRHSTEQDINTSLFQDSQAMSRYQTVIEGESSKDLSLSQKVVTEGDLTSQEKVAEKTVEVEKTVIQENFDSNPKLSGTDFCERMGSMQTPGNKRKPYLFQKTTPQTISMLDIKPKIMEPSVERIDSLDTERQILLSNGKPYKCSKCGLSFKYSFYLNAHLAVHSTDNYNCKFCNKNFKIHENFMQHMEPVLCSVCFKTHPKCQEDQICLKRQNFLKPFGCSHCPRNYRTDIQLQRHAKTHSVHKCYICDKVFKEKAKLSRHMGCHLNKKLYHCKGCNRTIYCLPSEVERHKALHQRVLSCPYCRMEFVSEHQLEAHTSKVHLCVQEPYTVMPSSDEKDKEWTLEAGEDVVQTSESTSDHKVRSQVAAILIDELLTDMYEEEVKESTAENWLEKVPDGVTKEKLIKGISECKLKDDVLRELTRYCQHDIIREGVSHTLCQEKSFLQKMSELLTNCEQSLAKVFSSD
ncbi:hypothetical protein SK128_019262 [Halocaridina rubra]|uniref:C2H2-type domain-containing protein n=1 Tax=Halocaridina rubra TaxID=373956 RepID=A0AAN8ZZ04_HALRR